ncbi:hypothetical protein HYC85_017156 [Camellia sinensis]|uniref:Uncharacterized protein n=1 Tax=Camellia sinensis TaxID=4442 RepID=A0A7J7H5D2_CAMSI|nr:hypothetical protein HYC85_017156 [Camellia sinensis]
MVSHQNAADHQADPPNPNNPPQYFIELTNIVYKNVKLYLSPVVSLASSLASSTVSSSYSSSSSSLVFTKLRSTPFLGLSFALTPLCSRRAKRMAHSLTRATLGLTHPSQIEPRKLMKKWLKVASTISSSLYQIKGEAISSPNQG